MSGAQYKPSWEVLGERAFREGRFADAASHYQAAGGGAGGHTKARQLYARAEAARLHAAAPNLLQELKEMVATFEPNFRLTDLQRARLEQARGLIQLVEGRR